MSNSTEDGEVPSQTSLWTKNSLDKFGVIIRAENSAVNIIKEWSLSVLHEDNLNIIETILSKADSCMKPLNFASLEEIWDALRSDRLPTDLQKLIKLDVDFQGIGTQSASFAVHGEDFLFTLAYIIASMEDAEKVVSDWQHQILFQKFLQMFGVTTMQQPFLKTKTSQLLGKVVHSKPDLLCFISDPRKRRPVLFVCEVKKNELVKESSPPAKKPRSSTTHTPSIPDSLLAKHIGELFVYLDKSVSSRAILGMTVEGTQVQVTLLRVNERILEKVKNSREGGCVQYDSQEERPQFYYSKPLNYLRRDDRMELVRSLLYLRMMQKKYEQ